MESLWDTNERSPVLSPALAQSRPQSHSLRLACDSAPAGSQDTWSTSCSLKHIIFREGAQVSSVSHFPVPTQSQGSMTSTFNPCLPLPQVTFVATFDVSPKAMLGDRLLLTANVSR